MPTYGSANVLSHGQPVAINVAAYTVSDGGLALGLELGLALGLADGLMLGEMLGDPDGELVGESSHRHVFSRPSPEFAHASSSWYLVQRSRAFCSMFAIPRLQQWVLLFGNVQSHSGT